MCDDFTRPGEDEALARRGLSRREFAAMGAAAALAAYGGETAARAKGQLAERMAEVTTPDGSCDAFFVHPAAGAHPGVILWPDVGGLRDAKKAMARRLAADGYAVLAVNPYYRDARAPVLDSFAEFRTPEGQARIKPMRQRLTAETTARDAAAFVAFLDAQPQVDKRRRIGTQGYCMTGPFAIRSAAVSPRIGAAASFHGGGLVTDEPDSPHRLMGASQAAFLIAIARNDDAKAPGDKDALRAAAAAAGRPPRSRSIPPITAGACPTLRHTTGLRPTAPGNGCWRSTRSYSEPGAAASTGRPLPLSYFPCRR